MGGGGALEMDDMMKKMMDGMKMGGGSGSEVISLSLPVPIFIPSILFFVILSISKVPPKQTYFG